MANMYTLLLILLWLSLVTTIACNDQIPINGKTSKRYNVTLDFDNLPTNDSGIGFCPSSPSGASFPYKGLFLESFTVKNVAKAMPDLDSPIDIMCASSAPNAIFGKRVPGYPWPHISLHDLTLPPDHARANVTFNMRSITLSTTGNVPGKAGEGLGVVTLTFLKLPPDTLRPGVPPEAAWPGITRGQPAYPIGQHIFGFGMYFGTGAHESIEIDFENIRKYVTGFAEGVDVIEMYAEVYKANKKNMQWELQGDWEFCADDISVEVVEGETGSQFDECTPLGRRFVWLQSSGDGSAVDAQELGKTVLRDLGRLPEEPQCPTPWVA